MSRVFAPRSGLWSAGLVPDMGWLSRPRCNLLQCCSRCTRPDQAIVVEDIMVQLAIMVHDTWFNIYAQYECWSNHSYMKSRPFCSRLPEGNSFIADTHCCYAITQTLHAQTEKCDSRCYKEIFFKQGT